MSLYSMMRTSVSGIQAQSNRLSTVADNIANADTTGYKRYDTEFSQLVRPGVSSTYTSQLSSGGVLTDIRQDITAQGVLTFTTSSTDLAIDGDGFFIVQDAGGTPKLTRSGAFVPDASGNLVNTAGNVLMGYPADDAAPAANGLAGLEPISVVAADLVAVPSTRGVFMANLPALADISAAPLPSANVAGAEFTQKTSLVAIDSLGSERMVDVYFTKTAAHEWEVALYDQSQAAAGGGFPYGAGPLAVQSLQFDPSTGDLAAASATDVVFTVPDGEAVTLDLSQMSQLAVDYAVLAVDVDGQRPSSIEAVEFAQDGRVLMRYSDGEARTTHRIPLATVISPDRLTAESGTQFVESLQSGGLRVGFPGEAGFGSVRSSALEQSNVDIADELTEMIQAQRSYTANSKVFQTGSELMDVLVNLKR